MKRFLYVLALSVGSLFIFTACNNGGSSSSTPTCSIGAQANGCSCPSGTTNVAGYCQSSGYYGYGGTGTYGYAGCQPCANPYNGQQGIQTAYGCATPITTTANGQCMGILPGGQVVQGIPMSGYAGYPYGGQQQYPYGYGQPYGYGGGYVPPVYGGGGYYPYYYRAVR